MLLLALLALLLCGVAVASVVTLLTMPRARAAARVEQLSAYGYVATPTAPLEEERADRQGVLTAIAVRIGDVLAERLSSVREADLRRLLVGAGMYTTSPRALLGYRVLGALVLGVLGVLAGHSVVIRVLLAAFFAVCGWTFPLTYVRVRATQRAQVVERDIPNLIDQIVVTLEAGVGFASSLQIASSRLSGPLGEEMRLTLQEQRMGVAMTESLQHLRERVDSANLKSFVRAVAQGERLGVSIGQVMRALAIDMRKRRRQRAEEQAQKAPTKMLLPLVFLILPSLFIVLLAPPVLQLVHGIG